MNHAISGVLDVVLTAARSKVTVSVPVALEIPIDCRRQCEAPDVELAILVQQWPFDVLLNDVAPLVTVYILILNDRLYVI